ncbi:hypothetical protein HY249_02590 [Candidatus Azambacteria bacterium]|nr:hypothetical protein [Candidatus Azambacteria bacterium]
MPEFKKIIPIKNGNVVIPIVLILGIFVGGVIVLQTKGIGASIITEGKKIFVDPTNDPNADPDGDGLKNWEEKIHNTDPKKYDTDGDGYSDGEEVISGYDPTKPAPNDALPETDTTTPRPTPKNLTEYLSQIMVQRVAAGEFKPVSDAKTAPDSALLNNEQILGEALAQIAETAKKEFVLPRIDESEIKISKNKTTKEEVVAYIANMSAILSNDATLKNIGISEAEVIEATVNTKDTTNISKLIDFYHQGMEKTKAVEAPQDFAEIHKEQLAIFELTKKILTAIKNFESDPATAAAAAEKYPDLKNILQDFTDKLIKKVGEYN